MENKSSLDIYRNKTKPGREWFYEGTWECSLLFKARCGALETNDRMRRWNGNEWWCDSCVRRGIINRDNLQHIIVECDTNEQERRILDNKLKAILGEHVWEERKQDNDQGLTTILGFQEQVPDITNATKEYLKRIWKKRLTIPQRNNNIEREHNYNRF